MPWPWQSGSSSKTKPDEDDEPSHLPRSHPISSSHRQIQLSWNDSLNSQGCDHYKDPRNWIPAFAVTTVLFCGMKFYRTYLRRITNVEYIHPDLYRKRRLFGRVTSVGDGDGFHLFHTPGGKWAGWGWLRKVPTDRKELKGKTISIRLAGVDAPEGAHFGRPSQPYAAEALEYLDAALLHKNVRAHIYRRDQYDRVVATVYLRRWVPFLKTDVGLEMLKRGLATTYEAKTGAEFGSPAIEDGYRAAEAEAKAKNLGLWSALKKQGKSKGWFGLRTTAAAPAKKTAATTTSTTTGRKTTKKNEENKGIPAFETPGQFKARMRALDNAGKSGEAK